VKFDFEHNTLNWRVPIYNDKLTGEFYFKMIDEEVPSIHKVELLFKWPGLASSMSIKSVNFLGVSATKDPATEGHFFYSWWKSWGIRR